MQDCSNSIADALELLQSKPSRYSLNSQKTSHNLPSQVSYEVCCEHFRENWQCFNSLWPSDAIRWHRCGSTLAQVMAGCLTAPSHYLNQCQTCQPLRILRNHYAFRVSNTPLRKPVKNVEKLRILRNFGAIRSIPRNLQQLSRLVVSRKSPAGQNIDKGLVYFTITIGIGVRFRHPINKGSCRGETMPNET